MNTPLLMFLVMLAVSENVAAQTSYYASIQYDFVKYAKDYTQKATLNMIVARFGVKVNNYFDTEIRAGTGTINDTVIKSLPYSTFDLTVDIDQYFGIYAKPQIPLTKDIIVYGIAGYSRVKVNATSQVLGIDFTTIDTGLSYGTGLQFALGTASMFTVEYLFLLRQPNYDLGSFNMSMGIMF